MLKFFPILIAVLFAASNAVFGAIMLNSPTTDWHPVLYPGSRSDYIDDQQTGSAEGDLVGSDVGNPVVQAALYFKYDALSDQIAFRTRVGEDSQPKGKYKGAFWIGFMLDSNDSVDLFAGFVNSGSSNTIGFFHPGATANISPNSASVGAALYSENGVENSNFLWTAVTVGPSGNDPVLGGIDDIGNNGQTDYFMTWVLPFSKLQTAATSLGFTITADTPFTLIAATAQNSQNINQDINGVGAEGNDSNRTFSELGAVSSPLTAAGGPIAIPEPGTVALCAIGAAYALFHMRSRRRR